jgi:hypothetical protein
MGNAPPEPGGRHGDDQGGDLLAGVPDPVLWLCKRKIALLSSADGILLRSRHGASPFAEQVQEAHLDSRAPALAQEALQLDPQLQLVRDRLVRPSAASRHRGAAQLSAAAPLSDHAFWAAYFSHVDAVKHELAMDYFLALSTLQQLRERRERLWLELWRALELDARAALRRAADGIAMSAATREAEADGGPEEGAADGMAGTAEYGDRGAYEVVRAVLPAALAEGWSVSGAAPTSPADPGAGKGANGRSSEELPQLLYRVWCCGDMLVPPPQADGARAPQVWRSPSTAARAELVAAEVDSGGSGGDEVSRA